MNQILLKNHTAAAAIPARRLVAFGAADGQVVQAAAATNLIVGVSPEFDVDAGERCDIDMIGVVEVVAGGTITRGQMVTSDAAGKAVPSVAGNRVAGIAQNSAVAGDFVDVLLAPSVH